MISKWQTTKLGEVLETAAGGTPLKSHAEYYSGGNIPWLLSGELKQGEIYNASNYITDLGLKNSSAKLFPVDTVLVAMYGATAGQVGILKFQASTNQAVCGILPNNSFLPKFIYYYFHNLKDALIQEAVGGAQPNISQEKIRNQKFPVINHEEQQRIVSVLDKVFESIDKAKENIEKNIKNVKEFRENYLESTLKNPGYEIVALKDICLVERGSSPRPIEKYQTDSPDGVNWIKIGDTKGIGKYLYKTKEKITREGAEQSRYVAKGDFILSNSMSYGKPFIMQTEGYIHDGWFVLRLNNNISHEYLYYVLISPYIQRQFKDLASGSTVKNISSVLVKKVVLPMPNLNEQKKIVNKIEYLYGSTGKLNKMYEQKMMLLEELKKSILAKAFRGEL